jgi:hypothetical protein
MNATNKKAGSTAAIIRKVCLFGVLLLVVGAFAFDRFVMVPEGMASVEKVMELDPRGDEDHKTAVRNAAGREPVFKEVFGRYEVEVYEFSRLLPVLPGPKVHVIYQNYKIVDINRGDLTEEDIAGLVN